MTARQIIAHRLANQRLAGPLFAGPLDVAHHFGAIQAQDYSGAKWAIGQRCGATDAQVEAFFNTGRILRTHLCRPTWHFVRAEDIRWILHLTASRVHQANASMARKRGLDAKLLRRATDIIAKALVGGKNLERDRLMLLLNRARIDTTDNRSSHFMMYAELEGVVCSGPRVGRQFTYALLDERAANARKFDREEALAELTRRYFTSRGPATLHDLTLWSGLTMADARKGIGMIGAEFACVAINGRDNWYPRDSEPGRLPVNAVHLLPNYDEYGIGYKDRSAFYDPHEALAGRNNPVFRHLLLHSGRMIGTWDRTLSKGSVQVTTSPFAPQKPAVLRAVRSASRRYADFLGLALAP